MCTSDLCPCDDADNMKALWVSKANETYIKTFKRTWVGTAAPDRNKPDSTYVMSFKTGTGVYKSYKECYNKVIKNLKESNNKVKNNRYMKQAMKQFNKGGWAFLSDLEKSAKCAGVCATPLFYLTRPLKEGPPTMDCVARFTEKFSNNMALAAVAFLTSLTLICGGICGLALCSDYNKPEDS
jgi:hypothetical protein